MVFIWQHKVNGQQVLVEIVDHIPKDMVRLTVFLKSQVFEFKVKIAPKQPFLQLIEHSFC